MLVSVVLVTTTECSAVEKKRAVTKKRNAINGIDQEHQGLD